MKKSVLLLTLALCFTIPTLTWGDCRQSYQDKVQHFEKRIERYHSKGKKIIGVSATAAGVPVGLMFGALFHGLTDATVGASIFAGTLFGGAAAAGAAGVAAVPVVSYDIYLHAMKNSYKKGLRILDQAASYDREGKDLKKLYKKLRKKDSNLTIDQLIDKINDANNNNELCQNPGKPLRFGRLQRLLPISAQESREPIGSSS